MDLGPKDRHPLASNTYEAIVMPIIFGLCAVITPTFTVTGLGILVVYVLLSSLYIRYAKKRNLHEYVRWRVIHNAVHVNAAVLFAMSILWRYAGGFIWLVVVFVILQVLSAIIGFRFRKTINQEIRSPKKRWGRLLATVGGIGGGGAALLAYILTPNLPILMLSLMYMGLLFVVAVFHAQWLFTEKPNWQPE